MSDERSTSPGPEGVRAPRADELLTVAEAASLARRSIRTLRRAYRDGSLRAYRDGNGRTVRIEYADLRDWMRNGTAARPPDARASRPSRTAAPARPRPSRLSENLDRLELARRRRAGPRSR